MCTWGCGPLSTPTPRLASSRVLSSSILYSSSKQTWKCFLTEVFNGIANCLLHTHTRLLGFGLVYLCRKRKLTVKEILGTSVPKHAAAAAAVAAGKAKRTTSSSSVVQYQVERQPGAGEVTASVHVYSPLDEV